MRPVRNLLVASVCLVLAIAAVAGVDGLANAQSSEAEATDSLGLTTAFITNSKTPGSASQCTSGDPNQLGYGVLCNTDSDSQALQDAALYAWRQFIGLSWPTDCAQTGGDASSGTCRRGQPSASLSFGDTSNALVWESYFHKTETYTGASDAPLTGCSTSGSTVTCNVVAGYSCSTSNGLTACTTGSTTVPLPTGCTASGATVACNFQTATTPHYQYTGYTVPSACAAVSGTAFVNLDETNQIGRNEMFAAVSDPHGKVEEDAHLIRFLAKLDETGYQYAVAQGLYDVTNSLIAHDKALFSGTENSQDQYVGGVLQNAALQVIDQPDFGYGSPVAGIQGDTAEVFFPAGSMEVKTAWRKLSSSEDPSRFVTSTVRIYENVESNDQTIICPIQETWAMQALHIIQRPVDAQGDTLGYFTFATFGQIDNILTPGNQPVELPNGAVAQTGSAITDPGLDNTFAWAEAVASGGQPSDPDRCSKASTLANGKDYYYCVQTVEFSGDTTEQPACDPSYQLYYANNGYTENGMHAGDVTPQGPICFTNRWNQIPPEVQTVNQAVQSLLCGGQPYDQTSTPNRYTCPSQYGPFAYYRLTGVQWVPVSRTNTNSSGTKITYQTNDAMDDGVYDLANEVVETNFNLQNFSGGQFPHVDALRTLGFYAAEIGTSTSPNSNYGEGSGVGLISDFGVGVPSAGKNVDQLQGISSDVFVYDDGSKSWTAYNMGGCMGCHGVAQMGGTDFSFIAGASTSEPDTYDDNADYSDSLQNGLERAADYD